MSRQVPCDTCAEILKIVVSDRDRGTDRGVNWLVQDTAHVASLAEADVTILTPGRAPGILHKPVASTAVITSDENTMVKVGATVLGQDTSCVMLEGALVSLDGN